jgi:hypothetical protein
MAWSAAVYESQSGDLVMPVELESGSWGRGDLTIRQSKVKLHDQFTKAQWRDAFTEWWDRQLVYFWGENPVYTGTILKAPAYDRKNGVLTVGHNDLSLVAARRWMHGVGTSNGEGGYQPAGSFSVSNRSLQGAIVDIMQVIYKAPISPSWALPVDLPAPTSGSFSKTWPFYNFEDGETMMRKIMNSQGGPDVDMQPKIVAGKLRWDGRIGSPLTGPGFDVHLDAEESAVTASGYGLDGEDTATGMHYPGKGSERDMRVGAAFEPPSAGLARDSIFWNANESNVTRLVSEARGRLDGLKTAVVTRTLTAKTRLIDPSALRIGSMLTVYSDDKLWEPEKADCRVVGYDGSFAGETFTIQAQEVSATL